MANDGGLSRRFLQAFILQALFISVTAVLGVWLARFVLEDVLVEQALEQEAAWFWEQRAMRPDALPPAARNIGWIVGGEDRPPSTRYRDLEPGIHALDSETGLHASTLSRGEALLPALRRCRGGPATIYSASRRSRWCWWRSISRPGQAIAPRTRLSPGSPRWRARSAAWTSSVWIRSPAPGPLVGIPTRWPCPLARSRISRSASTPSWSANGTHA